MTHNITKFLDELSSLEKNATKGEVVIDYEGSEDSPDRYFLDIPGVTTLGSIKKGADAKLIAESRSALPKLIEAMRVLVRVCEDVKINFDDTQFPENYCYIDFREKAKQALEKVEGILK